MGAGKFSFQGQSTQQVVIIGAGLSGLQAAYSLQQADVSCIVLEARDRVGGKLWSVPPALGRGTIDLGGAWINNVNQPRAYGLAKMLELEMIKQNISGDNVLGDHGRFAYGTDPPLCEEDRAAFARIRDSMQSLCYTVDLLNPAESLPNYGTISMEDFARSMGASETVRGLVNIWTAAMLGVESTEVSVVYFLHYCKAGGGFIQMRSDDVSGGQHVRFRGGSQALAKGLHLSLRSGTVVFSTTVERIEQHLDIGCIVTTRDNRQFRGRRVISTIPSTLLPQITFSPTLSADKTWLISQSKMGFYAKVFLIYSKPWWCQRGLCGLSQALGGPVSLTRDVSSDEDDFNALCCFVVGESGKAWAKKTQEQRMVDVLANVDRIYGSDIPKPMHTQEQIWNEEEFSQGAPCPVVPPSCLVSLSRDNWRPEGYVHFAGTETAMVWKGYMEGALASGERVAEEVITSPTGLQTTSRAKL